MFKNFLSLTLIACFFLTTLGPICPSACSADGGVVLPAPGTMVNLSPAYEPSLIKGLTIHKDNPFLFDFIVDTGHSGLVGDDLKKEGDRLVKYFFACLTIPDKDLWVNLSPYEKDRMVPQALGQTALGRDLLAQDYILKQLTASLIYPGKNLGKEFWDRIYAKAQQMYGTTQIPVNTFNKVWIVADKASVYEHGQTAFVVSGHLKVMLEQDYLAMSKHADVNKTTDSTSVNSLGFQIVREIILPEIEKEVNTGKNFSILRQIFNSLILASWYKKNLRQALLTQVYADKNTVKGVNLTDPSVKEQIYQQYLKAYKKGVFNYIKEDAQPDGQTIPRKYFSGGFVNRLQISPASFAEAEPATNPVGDDYAMSVMVDVNNLKISNAAMVTLDSPVEALELDTESNNRVRAAVLSQLNVPDGRFDRPTEMSEADFKKLIKKGYLRNLRNNSLWVYVNHDMDTINANIKTDFPETYRRILLVLEKRYYESQAHKTIKTTIRDVIQILGKDIVIGQASRDFGPVTLKNLKDALARYDLLPRDERALLPGEKVSLQSNVHVLGLTTRPATVLSNYSIETIEHLVLKTKKDLKKYRNMGDVAVNEIREKLAAHGFYLAGEGPEKPIVTGTLESNISVLGLSTRAWKPLNNANIQTVGQLVEKTSDDLRLRNFGKVSLEEVRAKLKEHGFYLKGDSRDIRPNSLVEDLGFTESYTIILRELVLSAQQVRRPEGAVSNGHFSPDLLNDLIEKGYLRPPGGTAFFNYLNRNIVDIRENLHKDFPASYEQILPIFEQTNKEMEDWKKLKVTVADMVIHFKAFSSWKIEPGFLLKITAIVDSYANEINRADKTKYFRPESSVNVLPLSVRVANALNNANIFTIGQLTEKAPNDLMRRNFGKVSLNEVRAVLNEYGFHLLGEGPVAANLRQPMAEENSDILKSRIDEVEFSVRTVNSLINRNIQTLGQLVEKTADELNLRENSLKEVRAKLKTLGYYLKGDNPSEPSSDAGKHEVPITLESSIDVLGLSNRAYRVLDNANFKTIGQVVEKTDIALRKYRNMGPASLNEIREKLKEHGFYLSGEMPIIQGDVLNAGIGIFNLQPFGRKILLAAGLDTVAKLKEKSIKELENIDFYGTPTGLQRVDIDKIRAVLIRYNLFLKGQLESATKINAEFSIIVEKVFDVSRPTEMGSTYVVIIQSGQNLPVETISRPLAESPKTTVVLIARDKPKSLNELRAAIKKQDAAMMGLKLNYGGIDLNTANMGMTVAKDVNGGVKINFDPAMIARIRGQGITSVVPVIIDVHLMPITDIRLLLGIPGD